jgi:hypothetical protein
MHETFLKIVIFIIIVIKTNKNPILIDQASLFIIINFKFIIKIVNLLFNVIYTHFIDCIKLLLLQKVYNMLIIIKNNNKTLINIIYDKCNNHHY